MELSEAELHQRESAKRELTYPAVEISGHQANAIARGFAKQAKKSNYTIWACSILAEHTHVVIARHTYKVEWMDYVPLTAGVYRQPVDDDVFV